MTDSDAADANANQPSRFRRALAAVGRAALLPVRGASYLVRSGKAHQHFFLPVLNGALGDQLAARYDSRAIRLSFRRGKHDVAVADLHLTEPRQKTVVFVHGLMGDEQIWQTGFSDAPSSRAVRWEFCSSHEPSLGVPIRKTDRKCAIQGAGSTLNEAAGCEA